MSSEGYCARLTSGRCQPLRAATASSELTISFSVGRGGVNKPADVKQIQKSLNGIPAGEGAPLVPLAVDGLMGPKTETAIFKFQVRHFGQAMADSRIDPERQSIRKLRELMALGNHADIIRIGIRHTETAAGANDPELIRVHDSLIQSAHWVGCALSVLAACEVDITMHLGLKGSSAPTRADWRPELLLVNRCFHLKGLPNQNESTALQAVQKLARVFREMQKVITSTLFTTPDIESQNRGSFIKIAPHGLAEKTFPGKTVGAWVLPGSWSFRDPRKGAIFINKDQTTAMTPDARTDVVIHEMAHFVGPNGTDAIVDINDQYGLQALHLNHSQAMRSASCYAWLAWLARRPQSQWLIDMG